MTISPSLLFPLGRRARILLVLLAPLVSTPAWSQATSWPDPPDIRTLKQQLGSAEAKMGTDHAEVAELLLTLGEAYREHGGYVPATPFVERALAIKEKVHGPSHIEVAGVLDRLGIMYLQQGDTGRARTAFVRARPILVRELGPKHPVYGLFLTHLGELQLLAGETTAAQHTVDEASKAFGDVLFQADHQWTEANRSMGLLYLGLGKGREAEQQLVLALTVRSEALDFENQEEARLYIASAQTALGDLYVAIGRLKDAEPLLREALATYEKKYGNDHPVLEDPIVNLAGLYEDKGDGTRARQYADRAAALHQRLAGYSHLSDWPLQARARRGAAARQR